MQNFKSTVPAELQAKVKAFADAFHGEWSHIISTGESYGTLSAVREIEGNYRSGWMPRQDGGFEISELYMFDVDSSNFTENQKAFANEQMSVCYDSFLSDNGIEPGTAWDDLTEEQKEELSEYEREWFSDGALVRMQIFVNGFGEYSRTDEKQVTIRLSINYSDAPYYREGDDEDLKQVILSADEFMQSDIAELIEQFRV